MTRQEKSTKNTIKWLKSFLKELSFFSSWVLCKNAMNCRNVLRKSIEEKYRYSHPECILTHCVLTAGVFIFWGLAGLRDFYCLCSDEKSLFFFFSNWYWAGLWEGVQYTQCGPIKNGCVKNQHSDFEKNKEPVVRILGLKNRFSF